MMPWREFVEFAQPTALALLPVWALVIAAVAWGAKQKRKRLAFWLSGDEVTQWWRRTKRQLFCFGAATLLLTVALARPRYFAGRVTVPAQGVDVVICLDVSHSMLCEDIKPSRLEFAQALIANLLQQLHPDDRIGLVVFGGSGFPLCPLTYDRSIVMTYLNLLEPSVMVYNPTTFVAEGLRASLKLLRRQTPSQRAANPVMRGGVIVLITDGEDQGSDWAQAAAECAKAGVPVFAFGIGTTKGAPVPEITEGGAVRGYKRDMRGAVAVSRLTTETLTEIARRTRGKVFLPADARKEIAALMEELKAYRQRVWTRQVAQWRELFPLLLLLSALLLMSEAWWQRSTFPHQRVGGS